MKKYLVVALGLAFAFLAITALIEAKPTTKAPIYSSIQNYSPYYIEKRFGGLEIRNKEDKEFMEKPNNMQVFHHFESLEKAWGQKHLKIIGDELIINDNNNTLIKKLPISTSVDKNFIHTYFGI